MLTTDKGAISAFIEKYYLHFNAASVVDAAKGYAAQLEQGSKMLVSLAGAMSTAEIGKIFAEIIRQDKGKTRSYPRGFPLVTLKHTQTRRIPPVVGQVDAEIG